MGMLAGTVVGLSKNWLEADMARHMLVELPLLLLAGAGLGTAMPTRFAGLVERFNELGLTGLVLASLVTAYWMIPAALDAALLHGSAEVAKCATFVLAGAILPRSFTTAPLALQAFFVGNVAWMMATAGLIYQNTPQQLCVSYLVDSQQAAGAGLVAAAVIIASTWLAGVAPALVRDI
jgi:hypothetical protein